MEQLREIRLAAEVKSTGAAPLDRSKFTLELPPDSVHLLQVPEKNNKNKVFVKKIFFFFRFATRAKRRAWDSPSG